MTQEQINELRKLAQAATQGKWEYTHGGCGDNGKFLITEYFVILEDDDVAIAADIVDPKTSRPSKANAEYIAAANPAAILALIQQRDELLAEMRVIEDILNRETNTTDIGYEVFRRTNFIRRAIATTEQQS